MSKKNPPFEDAEYQVCRRISVDKMECRAFDNKWDARVYYDEQMKAAVDNGRMCAHHVYHRGKPVDLRTFMESTRPGGDER